MSDWRQLCCAADLVIEERGVIVQFDNRRSHRVRIAETEHTFELLAVVARRARIADPTHLPEMLWRRNRVTQLVSFKVDRHGRVIGTGWCPRVGITADELQDTVRHVAAESDRFEFLLTGRDQE